jgi:hypothetical protein
MNGVLSEKEVKKLNSAGGLARSECSHAMSMCDTQTHQTSNQLADHNTKQGGSGIEQHIEQKLLAVEIARM